MFLQFWAGPIMPINFKPSTRQHPTNDKRTNYKPDSYHHGMREGCAQKLG